VTRLLLAVLLLLGLAAPAVATPRLERDIRAAADQWVAAYTAGDLEALMRLYTPDTKVMLGGQRKMDGLPAVRAYFTDVLKRPRGTFELKFEDVQLTGPRTAQLISLFRMTVPQPDGSPPRVFTGRSLLIYKRGVDGRWLIWRDIDNSTPDATDAGVFP
jgi:uncharacterized protein (TIGR02246 family)